MDVVLPVLEAVRAQIGVILPALGTEAILLAGGIVGAVVGAGNALGIKVRLLASIADGLLGIDPNSAAVKTQNVVVVGIALLTAVIDAVGARSAAPTAAAVVTRIILRILIICQTEVAWEQPGVFRTSCRHFPSSSLLCISEQIAID